MAGKQGSKAGSRHAPGEVAAVGLPPPLDEAEVRLAVLDAVVVLVDHRARVVGVVGRVRVRHPVAAEDVAARAGGGRPGKC